MLVRYSITAAVLLLAGLFGSALLAQSEDDILRPDQAFRISGLVENPETVIVRWDIADGYYMYRNKIRVRTDTPGFELGSPDLPPGKIKNDEFFGSVEIYRGKVSVPIPLSRGADAPDTLNLQISSQGCADLGICFPPHTQKLALRIPAPPQSAQSTGDAAVSPVAARSATLDRLVGLTAPRASLSNEEEIPDPKDAFRFSASVESADRVRAYWQIAEGTYLYKDKITLEIKDSEDIRLGKWTLPKAKVKKDSIKPDGTIGDVEVFVDEIDLDVPLVRLRPEATEFTLVARFQGCAEIGVCYPPRTESQVLSLPVANRVLSVGEATEPPPPPPPAAPVSEQDRLAATLAGGNMALIVGGFFLAGLLLAFTPCVFPMIPILSGILAGQGENITPRKGFSLSLVYVLAMAITYTVAGVLAGMFGQNLQAAFQDPWILSFFAAVFVLLALSMFGFYDLQLPSALQTRLSEISNRQEGGTILGVAIMGFLSALIVGPCVAPPLVGALIYIGQTGDAVLGGLALFTLSLGMGAPLIAIGTSAGKLLPRAGSWMDIIKSVFGVLMLAVAIILLERILPAEIAMFLWGVLLVVSGIYMGAFKDLPVEASGWARLWKGLGLVILIYGALMLVGAAAGGKDTLQPLRGLGFAGGATETPHLAFRRIKTVDDLNREVAAASSRNQPVMLDFYADWCISCKEMEKYTFSDPAVIKALDGFTLLQADVTKNDEDDKTLLQGHFGLPGPPSIMFYDRNGIERKDYRVVGFMNAEDFSKHIRQAVP